MSDCNENINDIVLPHDDRVEVNVNQNENPDSATLNRNSNRLLRNDEKLLEYIKNILSTSLSEGLSGCIQGSEPGCIKLDLDYISRNICISLADLDGNLKLNDLCDVQIDNPLELDTLVYSETSEIWYNSSSDISGGGGLVNQKEIYEPIFNHTSLPLSAGITTTSNTVQSITYSYPVSGFNDDWNIDIKNVVGFYVYCRNFGRLDTVPPGGDMQSWSITGLLPDGTITTLNSHLAFNEDDDGGTATTVFIPYDSSQAVGDYLTLTVRAPSIETSDILFDETGGPMNVWQIMGAKVRVDNPLLPKISYEYLKLSVRDGETSSNGSISDLTNADLTIPSWSSEDSYNTYNDFTNFIPIDCPNTASKTEIECNALITNSTGLISDDPGVDGNSASTQVTIKIMYDWVNRKITGHVLYGTSGTFAGQIGAIYNGVLNTTVNADFSFGGITAKSSTFAKLRRISSLPVLSDILTDEIITRNLNYTIRHYETSEGEPDIRLNVLSYDDTDNPLQSLTVDEVCNTAIEIDRTANITFNLPPAIQSIGCTVTFSKLNIGDVIIVSNGTDKISNSTAGGSIYNNVNSEDFATLTLLAINSEKWVIQGAHGTWITT